VRRARLAAGGWGELSAVFGVCATMGAVLEGF
jgi:hypothetical protein